MKPGGASECFFGAVCEIESGGVICDRVEVNFGLRAAVFDAERGFLLNGEPLKIKVPGLY